MRFVNRLACVVLATLIASGCEQAPGGKGNLLAKIKERGVVRVGVKADTPPFGWKDDFGYCGFDVDIATALVEEMGIGKAEFITVTSANRIKKVADGEADMAIASKWSTSRFPTSRTARGCSCAPTRRSPAMRISSANRSER